MNSDAKLFRNALEYFPETGLFVWKVSPAWHIAAGSEAGSTDSKGYWRISYKKCVYKAHRVAWLLMTGEWPDGQLDHINLDRSDNRWVNLRLATRSQNMANRRGYGKFPKGVRLHRCGKFHAQVQKDGESHYLGTFETLEEAVAAYEIAAKEYFGEFARTA